LRALSSRFLIGISVPPAIRDKGRRSWRFSQSASVKVEFAHQPRKGDTGIAFHCNRRVRTDHAALIGEREPAMIGQGLPRLIFAIPRFAGGLQQVAVMRLQVVFAHHGPPPILCGIAQVFGRIGQAIRQRHGVFLSEGHARD
jgi:hypothetical protein